jgi:hypothetical protein
MKASQTGKIADQMVIQLVDEAHRKHKLQARDMYVFMGQCAEFAISAGFHGIMKHMDFESARSWLVLVLSGIAGTISETCNLDVSISVKIKEKKK